MIDHCDSWCAPYTPFEGFGWPRQSQPLWFSIWNSHIPLKKHNSRTQKTSRGFAISITWILDPHHMDSRSASLDNSLFWARPLDVTLDISLALSPPLLHPTLNIFTVQTLKCRVWCSMPSLHRARSQKSTTRSGSDHLASGGAANVHGAFAAALQGCKIVLLL